MPEQLILLSLQFLLLEIKNYTYFFLMNWQYEYEILFFILDCIIFFFRIHLVDNRNEN